MNYHAAKAYILDRLQNDLSPQLTYHGIHHTLDVLKVATQLCQAEGLSVYDTMLVKTASLFHDSGFTVSNVNHEEHGCHIVRTILPNYGYTKLEIDKICSMIMATKIPQSPQGKMEKILCDADLDYLGRPDFYRIGSTLYQELQTFNILETKEQWNQLQIQFLEVHHFWTATNRKNRTPQKLKYLNELKKIKY